jgi:hypothetical protein
MVEPPEKGERVTLNPNLSAGQKATRASHFKKKIRKKDGSHPEVTAINHHRNGLAAFCESRDLPRVAELIHGRPLAAARSDGVVLSGPPHFRSEVGTPKVRFEVRWGLPISVARPGGRANIPRRRYVQDRSFLEDSLPKFSRPVPFPWPHVPLPRPRWSDDRQAACTSVFSADQSPGSQPARIPPRQPGLYSTAPKDHSLQPPAISAELDNDEILWRFHGRNRSIMRCVGNAGNRLSVRSKNQRLKYESKARSGRQARSRGWVGSGKIQSPPAHCGASPRTA